jgi:hypothetical protein
MKKLLVFIMLPALVLLAASSVSAFDFFWGRIHGTYAMTATGTCLWAPDGFNPKFFSPNAYSSHFAAQGLWNFEPNGTGKAEVTQFGISAPPIVGAPTTTAGGAASVKYSFDFDYAMTHDGKITVWPRNLSATFLTGPKTGITYTVEPAAPIGSTATPEPIAYSGMVSTEWDHKTLIINSGNELQKYFFSDETTCYGICNSGRVLIRVQGAYAPTGLR